MIDVLILHIATSALAIKKLEDIEIIWQTSGLSPFFVAPSATTLDQPQCSTALLLRADRSKAFSSVSFETHARDLSPIWDVLNPF